MLHPALKDFHPLVAQWFAETFGTPTPPQAEGWPRIAAGENVLLLAPTGSGKTLAAFLKAIDGLYREMEQEATTLKLGTVKNHGVKILYVSPLKAPKNCLDILAQQLVAMTATGEVKVEQVWPIVRSAYNFSGPGWGIQGDPTGGDGPDGEMVGVASL
ncbi:MAG: DEAD/DEAH box helicase [Firmicutes bacterium]|nr:DEAD/DEAH box helicase [Bacillota bacterium]